MELFVHFEFVFMTFGYYAEQQRAGHVRGHENSIGERSSHSTGGGGPTRTSEVCILFYRSCVQDV